ANIKRNRFIHFVSAYPDTTGSLKELASRSSFKAGDPRAEYSLSVVQRTMAEGKAVILADTELEDSEELPESVALKRIKSVMCVPLFRKTRVLGALYVHSVDKPFGYRKSDLYLLTALSGSAAVAIENALLFRKKEAAEADLRKAHDELEERVEQRTKALSLVNNRLKKEIDERKRTEAALKESEELLRDLFDNAKDLIQSVTPEGRFLFVNRIWMETLGYTPEEVPDLRLFDVVAPESLAHCRDALDQVLSGEPVKDLEAVFLSKDGQRIHVDGNINCKFDQGRPVSTRGIFRDVTARKAAEETREEVEERFRNLARAAQDAIISIDHQGVINYWNRAAAALFGHTSEEALGKDAHALLAPERYREQYAEKVEAWRRTGQGGMLGQTRELAALRADGTEFPIELSLSSGRVKGKWNALGIVRDITERKEAEAALQKRTWELDMRYKQVYCLYAVSRLKGDPEADLETVLRGIVGLIPPALQYPEIACARLTYEEMLFVSADFQETPWTLERAIRVNGRQTGRIEIFYTEEGPGRDEGPFLVEERTLLQVIAEQVGEIIELRQAEEDLATAREREIEIGSKIQQTLLLGSPPRNVSGIRIAAMTLPSHRIDGDFYEFITLSDRILDLIVGDVMGKGVPAALLGAGTKGHFLKALNFLLSPNCPRPLPAEAVPKTGVRVHSVAAFSKQGIG
ncbi:MAG: PAS domain S-box protein, partial [Candidatus Syntrophosphaera sp.]